MWGLENGRFELLNMRKDQCPECLGYNTTTTQYKQDYFHSCNDCELEWSEGYG